MMGIAQFSDDVPIIKGVSGVLVQKEIVLPKDEPCIRCGMCIDACSIGLLPLELGNYIEHNMWEEVKTLDVFDCIECGSCAWVCPAKRNLVHLIKYGKVKVKSLGK
jgi:electron transport complex protein RnfC